MVREARMGLKGPMPSARGQRGSASPAQAPVDKRAARLPQETDEPLEKGFTWDFPPRPCCSGAAQQRAPSPGSSPGPQLQPAAGAGSRSQRAPAFQGNAEWERSCEFWQHCISVFQNTPGECARIKIVTAMKREWHCLACRCERLRC